jgi:hypothetical protein
MNTPQIAAIDTALEIYYKNPELCNKHILALFGNHSTATINRLKQRVKAEMIARGVRSYSAYSVNTKIAFEVWGIDVDDLEKRRAKLQKLGL